MEPTLLSASVPFPVDLAKIYQGMHKIATDHKLLHPKSTDYLILECETHNMVREAFKSAEDCMSLECDLLELWFPSLSRGVEKHGHGWSHFWDLDLEVGTILTDAGYPENNPDLEEESGEEMEILKTVITEEMKKFEKGVAKHFLERISKKNLEVVLIHDKDQENPALEYADSSCDDDSRDWCEDGDLDFGDRDPSNFNSV